MLKIAALVCIVAVAAFLAYVALKSADFRITRSQSIKAPPETVFALINDLHGFNRWNPFALGDPAMKLDYSGPQTGKGAAYTWDSTGKTGKRRIAITESYASSRALMQLEFLKPMAATNTAEFTLASADATTTVTWSMFGRNSYAYKLMGTIFNMDKMVGREFETGLVSLKALSERQHRN